MTNYFNVDMRADRLLRLPDLTARLGVSKSFIYARMREGIFPLPVKIGRRLVAWRAKDIDAWLEDAPRAFNELDREPRAGAPGCTPVQP